MNFKLRLALPFTLFVAILLTISSFVIYLLYNNYRESSFLAQVKAEGHLFNDELSRLKKQGDSSSPLLAGLMHTGRVSDERIIILNPAGKIITKLPDTLHFIISPDIFEKIKKQKEYYWTSDNDYQNAGFVLENSQDVLVAAGFDKAGFKKLSNLRLILFFGLIGGVFITALVSFFLVRQVLMPLTKLSAQIKRTTFQNLTQRIAVTDARNEINDIARNFNSMLERLSRAFEFQKSFVYHASHELRTPLATMLSQTESALNQNLSEAAYKKLLVSLKEDQQELIELTNSLLMVSQFDQAEPIQNWPRLRIDEVLYETISICKRMFPGLVVNMSFGTMPETDDDFVIEGNEALLKSAFSNIIKNANLYSIDQKVDITLESYGDTILVHFDNKGTQLPADEKENIMTPFFRGGNALKTKGYGLGLSIVHRFITLHKGTITYTPVSNDINRFTITMNKAKPRVG